MNMNENPKLTKAKIMFAQIEQESNVCSHWLLIGLKSMLKIDSSISLKDIIEMVELSCPNAKETSEKRMKDY